MVQYLYMNLSSDTCCAHVFIIISYIPSTQSFTRLETCGSYLAVNPHVPSFICRTLCSVRSHHNLFVTMMRRHCNRSSGVIAERLEEPQAENEALPRNPGQMSNFLYSVRNWTFFYFSLFALLIIVCQSALSVILVMQLFSWMIYLVLLSSAFQECRKAVRREIPTINYGLIYGLCISFLLSSSNTLIPVPYSRLLFWLKPCQKMDQIMYELRYATKLPADLPIFDKQRPLQAMGLDNSYMLQFKEALEIHFDRYSRNETEPFAYVKHLNLIGNIFDDKGAGYLLTALNHPHAYTSDLLLGRNLNLGDKTATELSMLIQSHRTLLPLTWLEFGGTSVTASGLKQLYSAVGETFSERPSFSFMGFGYTDKRLIQKWPWLSNPIPKSISELHQAKFLEEIVLTGNMLDDDDMTELVENILQTNITKLGLINNRIGARGVERLLPLTKHLQELQLGINWRIGDAGAILLADALKDPNNSTTLETLTLFNCRVGQAGADAFLSIFPQNKKLKYLSLDGRDIRKETLQAIKKATIENYKYHY